jgi:uncharacterized protein (TIGR02145 family)
MKKWTMNRAGALVILGIILMLEGGCSKKKESVTLEATTGTVTDADGNKYKTVKIGNQWWMAENLRTTLYNNGVPIPLVADSAMWRYLSTPAYCWLNNDISYKTVYGALYNWNAVGTGKLAPVGWHIPSDAEWTTLTSFLEGESVAGGRMKTTGTIEDAIGLWFAPNTDTTNASSFSALPGGSREGGHFFLSMIGHTGFWWSSNFTGIGNAWGRELDYNSEEAYRDNWATTYGFSVRCVKD